MAATEHTPPKAVRDAAKQALVWLSKGTVTWGTEAGHKRAQQLAAGKPVSEEDITDIHGYFARHGASESETDAQGWGDDKNPSKGYAAWQGWGGDAGKDWVDGIVAERS